MKRFKYKAKDKTGGLVSGEVEANDEQHAAKLVRQRELVVISINKKTEIPVNFINNFKSRISSADTTNFTRQLATMINAGLPLTEALLIMRAQSQGAMQKVVSQILADVEEGEALSNAMNKHKNAFSETYIALIRSGEVGGVMDEVLQKLADNLEKQQEFKGKVRGAMIYPAVIVFGMLAVSIIMMVVVVPRMTDLYDQFDAELPITTKLLIATSDAMVKLWPLMLIGFAGLVWTFKWYRNTDAGHFKTDELLLKIPIIGDLQKQIVLTELSRTLSLMVGSGVSILEGLRVSAGVVANKVLAKALDESAEMVEKGFPIAFAFSRHPEAFPFIMSQMIAVGEETGKMDEVLAKVSHVFEVESEQKVKALTAAIEPAILIVLGVGVAFLVISIIMPIYNLTTQI